LVNEIVNECSIKKCVNYFLSIFALELEYGRWEIIALYEYDYLIWPGTANKDCEPAGLA